jgi:hypothetical protein
VITKRDDVSRGLTREELLALPAAVDLQTANRALPLSRTTGYDLAKRGRYPCTVLRLGNAYRVVTADLLKLLHIDVCAAVLVGVRGVSEEHASESHRLVCVISTSRATMVSPSSCAGRFIASPRAGGARGARTPVDSATRHTSSGIVIGPLICRNRI